MRFEELDLNDNVLDALYDMRFDECTPVQEKCIPEILKGNDLLAVAQTGTGKTAAYLLPVLSKLDDGGYPEKAINCIVMSPTRELAQQIDQAMQGFGYYLENVSSVAVYGGNDGNRYDQEVKSLHLGADVVIATPGRLISHISLGNIDMSKVSFFILDEADRMLDMGFSDDILKIAKALPDTCQTIMFSATMPKKIEDLAKTLLKNPVEVKLAVSKPAEKIKQSAYVCYETQKLGIINDIFKAGDLKRVIIFCGSKLKVKQVAGALVRAKINCGEMHSDLDQATRDDVMFKFKSGQYDVLVATDIVARGIDIDDIAMVINYDVPRDAEDYVHRIGRTARAERDGVAITFVSDEDMYYFQQIEKFLEKVVEKTPLPEGLGEAPEYKQLGKPIKKSAKARRRSDRDHNSHKDNKRRNNNRRQQNGEPRKEEGQQKDAPQQTDAAAQDNNKQQSRHRRNGNRNRRPQQEGGQKNVANEANKRNDRSNDSQQQENRNNRHQQQNNRRKDNDNAVANAEGGNNKQRQKRRGNVEGNYKKRNNNPHTNSQNQPKPSDKYKPITVPGTVKKENTVKKFIKKIFGFKN